MELFINLIGCCAGLYVGIWKMLISTIIMVCTMFDGGTLTEAEIAMSILKCLLAIPVTEFVYTSVTGILLTIYYTIKGE